MRACSRKNGSKCAGKHRYGAGLLIAVCLMAGLAWQGYAAEPIFYSFRGDGRGGVARLQVDPTSGMLLSQQVIFEASGFMAYKLAAGPDGIAVTSLVDDGSNLAIIPAGGDESRTIALGREPTELRLFDGRILVGTRNGRVHLVNYKTGIPEHVWNMRRSLTPPARRPEDIQFEADGRHAWVAFQKDNRVGDRFGSRLAYLDLDSRKVLADLHLPRDRPELHYTDDPNDRRARGPGPEIVLIFEESNTLMLTLDLYGAVAFMDLSEARRGRMVNYTTLSTALDGSFGSAFPDRVAVFEHGGRRLVLVSNVGVDGGAVVVDPAKRAIVQTVPAPGGLNTLTYLPTARTIASASSGKRKERRTDGVTKVIEARPELVFFDLMPEGSDTILRMRIVETDLPTHHCIAVAPSMSPLLLVAAGDCADTSQQFPWGKSRTRVVASGDCADTLLVIDARSGTTQGRFPAVGNINRFAQPALF